MALNKILDACHCNPFHHDDPENEVKDAPMPPEQAPKEVMADDDDANAADKSTRLRPTRQNHQQRNHHCYRLLMMNLQQAMKQEEHKHKEPPLKPEPPKAPESPNGPKEEHSKPAPPPAPLSENTPPPPPAKPEPPVEQ